MSLRGIYAKCFFPFFSFCAAEEWIGHHMENSANDSLNKSFWSCDKIPAAWSNEDILIFYNDSCQQCCRYEYGKASSWAMRFSLNVALINTRIYILIKQYHRNVFLRRNGGKETNKKMIFKPLCALTFKFLNENCYHQ